MSQFQLFFAIFYSPVVAGIRIGSKQSLLAVCISFGDKTRATPAGRKGRQKGNNGSHAYTARQQFEFIPTCVSFDCYFSYGLRHQIDVRPYMICVVLMCRNTRQNQYLI